MVCFMYLVNITQYQAYNYYTIYYIVSKPIFIFAVNEHNNNVKVDA